MIILTHMFSSCYNYSIKMGGDNVDLKRIESYITENCEQLFPRSWINDDILYDDTISHIMPILKSFNDKQCNHGVHGRSNQIKVSVARENLSQDFVVKIRVMNGPKTVLLTPTNNGYMHTTINS